MMKKLLIPLDGTPQAASALHLAEMLVRSPGGELVLLRAVNPSDADEAEEASRYLSSLATALPDGLRVETAVVHGDAADEILARALSPGIDLIVMATHARVGLERAFLGSVAERVLRHSPVPVILLRPGEEHIARIGTVLVPVDGTPGSLVALSAAKGLAEASGARVVLIQVVVPLPRYAAGWGIAPRWEHRTRAAAQQYLDQLAHLLVEDGLRVEGRAEIGPVAPTIAAVANAVGADIIVMSTHALTGPARAVLGSVADEVVRTASQPVLLIRQERPGMGHVQGSPTLQPAT